MTQSLGLSIHAKHEKRQFLAPSAIGGESGFLVVCFLHASGQSFSQQTPGLRLSHSTGRRVNTVTLGWIGAHDERAPLRFHDTVVGFVDGFLPRSRNLADDFFMKTTHTGSPAP